MAGEGGREEEASRRGEGNQKTGRGREVEGREQEKEGLREEASLFLGQVRRPPPSSALVALRCRAKGTLNVAVSASFQSARGRELQGFFPSRNGSGPSALMRARVYLNTNAVPAIQFHDAVETGLWGFVCPFSPMQFHRLRAKEEVIASLRDRLRAKTWH